MALLLPPDATRCSECLAVQYCAKVKCRYCHAPISKPLQLAVIQEVKPLQLPARLAA